MPDASLAMRCCCFADLQYSARARAATRKEAPSNTARVAVAAYARHNNIFRCRRLRCLPLLIRPFFL